MSQREMKKCFEYCATWCDWNDPEFKAHELQYGKSKVWAENANKAKQAVVRMSEDTLTYLEVMVRRLPDYDLVPQEKHPLSALLTDSQIGKMAHAIGLYSFESGITKYRGHRNYYQSENEPELESLIPHGLIETWFSGAVEKKYYGLTDLGIEVILSLFPRFRNAELELIKD